MRYNCCCYNSKRYVPRSKTLNNFLLTRNSTAANNGGNDKIVNLAFSVPRVYNGFHIARFYSRKLPTRSLRHVQTFENTYQCCVSQSFDKKNI